MAGMKAFADTLLYGDASHTELPNGEGPSLGQLLEGTGHEGPQEVSLMPLKG